MRHGGIAWWTVAWVGTLMAGCGAQSVRGPEDPAALPTQQRLDDLERRVQRLEGRPPVEAPLRSREEIQAHLQRLEAERAKLLLKYTDQHPAVRDIDRKLLILNEQLGKLAP